MTWAVFRAALLSFVADTGALLMSFGVPLVFFLVFAAVFSSSAGGPTQLGIAIADELQSDQSRALLRRLLDVGALHGVGDPTLTREEVRDLVRRGQADVGLVIRADGEPLDDIQGLAAPPLLLLVDPSRGFVGELLAGHLRQAWLDAFPDVALRDAADIIGTRLTRLTPAQEAEIAAGLTRLRAGGEAGDAGFGLTGLLEREQVAGSGAADDNVAYYAGAITFLFLLLAAAQSALGFWDDRESGVLDRILAGPGGLAVAVNGRFLFLILQGLIQTVVIFVAAWLVYGVDLPGHLPTWSVVAVASVTAAAGIAMALVIACRSRVQAQLLPTILILIVSAVGGSMVPRFFMPPWLQALGWFTPNTWALEAWAGVFWRDESLAALLPYCAVLAGVGIAGLLVAHLLGRRERRA